MYKTNHDVLCLRLKWNDIMVSITVENNRVSSLAVSLSAFSTCPASIIIPVFHLITLRTPRSFHYQSKNITARTWRKGIPEEIFPSAFVRKYPFINTEINYLLQYSTRFKTPKSSQMSSRAAGKLKMNKIINTSQEYVKVSKCLHLQ